jgi:hypothetical protein
MKKLITAILAVGLLIGFAGAAMAERVSGHFRSNGTYVQPYTRSNPNSTVIDNYSFKGNINPNNGREGTNYYRHSPTSPYYEGPSSNSFGSFNSPNPRW